MVTPRRGRPAAGEALSDDAIKAAARRQMAELGTAGLSLRGIARDLHVTAPALYNYFPRLDDLITALVVDAFTAMADAFETAIRGVDGTAHGPRIRAGALAYRQWAVDHPVDFELIYGNPIPGYVAPADVTIPLAARPFLAMTAQFVGAYRAEELTVPAEYATLPPAVEAHLHNRYTGLLGDAPPALLTLLASSWARIHGMVMLELFGHFGPVVGDPAAYFAYEIDAFLARLGMAP